eukprot:scaffold6416_cov113-Isochrysis_galbana.AAC.4
MLMRWRPVMRGASAHDVASAGCRMCCRQAEGRGEAPRPRSGGGAQESKIAAANLRSECNEGIKQMENKTPRARGGRQWRPDSSCWSWRRSKWPRRKAPSVSELTARTRVHCRYNCTPKRPPGASPGRACTLLTIA